MGGQSTTVDVNNEMTVESGRDKRVVENIVDRRLKQFRIDMESDLNRR